MADDRYSKRKYDDPSPPPQRTDFSSGPPPATPPAGGTPSYNSVPPPPDEIQIAKQREQFNAAEAKRPRVDNGDDDAGGFGGGGSLGGSGGGGSDRISDGELGFSSSAGGGHGASTPPLSSYGGYQGTSKKIEIPIEKVGVIIGKSGETIRYIQLHSEAKIQVTRNNEAEPGALTRPVELSGTPEQISKAEQLIKEILAEADAGSSGAGSGGRKFNAPKPGVDTFLMKIANSKVGLVIGKGGETIKSMEAKSGARIQVLPLPAGDTSTETTIRIDGAPEQVEIGKELVTEVTSKGYCPPCPQSNWGPPGAPTQQPGYGYVQPGAYPGAPPQYGAPQQPYGSYPPTSGGYQTGWDPSHNQQAHTTPLGTGYNYYNQQQQQQSAPGAAASTDASSYNYGQPPTYASQGYDSTYSQQSGGQQAPQQPQSGGQQAPQRPYGSYPPTSGGYQTGWDQSQNKQSHTTPPVTGYDYYNQQHQPQHQSAPGTAASTDATSYNYGQPPTYASQGSQQSGGQQAYGHDGYSGYQTQGQQQGYSQQGYGVSAYGSAANSAQVGSAPSYGGPVGASQAFPGQQTSTPAAGSHPGYASQPPTSAASSYPAQGSAPPSGYGAPPPQSGYDSQPPPQGGYSQGASGQPSPQGQKPPTSPSYGQALPPGSAQGGYGQYGYSQPG